MSLGGPSTFPSELELLRNYLNKDHKFRNKIVSAPARRGWRLLRRARRRSLRREWLAQFRALRRRRQYHHLPK